VTNDLPHLPATEALALFRARELSPVELMTAVIERAEAVEPVINAFAETFYEQAISAAKAAQERYAKAAEPRPVPVVRAVQADAGRAARQPPRCHSEVVATTSLSHRCGPVRRRPRGRAGRCGRDAGGTRRPADRAE
jgi:hypothetical protein